jgi:hypothetical protein
MSIFNLDEQYNRNRVINEFDQRDNEIKQLQARITELETAARPFSHPDLCKRLPNNGSSSDSDAIIFVRNNAKITLADCRRIAAVLNKSA